MSRALPPIRYADNGGLDIAYQVIGESGPTLVGIPGMAQNIELVWEDARAARFLHRLGSFCRLIHFDKRGTGMSGRGADFASFPDRVTDLLAVLAAENVEEAFIGGFSEGGSMAALFAATYPERTQGLILIGTAARLTQCDDLPWNPSIEDYVRRAQVWAQDWGSGRLSTHGLAPSLADDADYVRWMGRYERQSLAPRGVVDLCRLNAEIDVRSLLPAIQSPTVVIHRRHEYIDVRNAEYLAANIAGARLVVLDGADHLPWVGDQDAVLDEMEVLITGNRRAMSSDRVLATVLFTDIVDSTVLADRLGDGAWRRLLDEHDRRTAAIVSDCGGRVVKTTGDGVLATFDSPSRAMEAALRLRIELAPTGVLLRAGIHTGEIERRGDDIGGIAVNIAARIEALADDDEILVSGTVKDLSAGSPFTLADRGAHPLKGVSGSWRLFALSR